MNSVIRILLAPFALLDDVMLSLTRPFSGYVDGLTNLVPNTSIKVLYEHHVCSTALYSVAVVMCRNADDWKLLNFNIKLKQTAVYDKLPKKVQNELEHLLNIAFRHDPNSSRF